MSPCGIDSFVRMCWHELEDRILDFGRLGDLAISLAVYFKVSTELQTMLPMRLVVVIAEYNWPRRP